jgi:hypothetical protein
MPARFQPQAQIQRPLQNEINALVKLVNGVSLAAFYSTLFGNGA